MNYQVLWSADTLPELKDRRLDKVLIFDWRSHENVDGKKPFPSVCLTLAASFLKNGMNCGRML